MTSPARGGNPEIEEALGAADFQDRMHEVFAELRLRQPVYWSPSLGYWLVTSFALTEEVLRNPADYSSDGATGSYIRRMPTEVVESLSIMPYHFEQPGLIRSDGAKHTSLRRIVNPPFTPAALAPLADDIRRQVGELLDRPRQGGDLPNEPGRARGAGEAEVNETAHGDTGENEPGQAPGIGEGLDSPQHSRDDGRLRDGPGRVGGVAEPFDVVEVLAKPLPVMVIAGLLGVPADALDRFPSWSVQLARFFTGPVPQPDIAHDLDRALVEWRGFVGDLIDERRAEPRGDFISVVAEAIATERMTRQDGIAIVVHALQAGHETSTNLIANAIYLLLRHPEQLALARTSPQMLEHAIEEVLRFEPPAITGRRTATRPLSLGGTAIEAGDTVVVNIAAAHRDPDQYPEPDRFDVSRRLTKADHMGFGRGAHFCLGASLARLEVSIAVEEFLTRFGDARLVDPTPRWKVPRDQRGPAELWVRPSGNGR